MGMDDGDCLGHVDLWCWWCGRSTLSCPAEQPASSHPSPVHRVVPQPPVRKKLRRKAVKENKEEVEKREERDWEQALWVSD